MLNIIANSLTSGKGINLTSSSNTLNDGNLFYLGYTGASTNTQSLAKLINNDATAVATTILELKQKSTNSALEISTANKAIKLKTDSSFSGIVDDNCSETYLLKGVQGVGEAEKDFTISLDDSSTYFIRSFIVGRYKSPSGSIKSATYTIDGYLDRAGVNLTIDYTMNTIKETDTSWDIELQNSNGNLIIRCKGTGNSTRWLVKLELVKITF